MPFCKVNSEYSLGSELEMSYNAPAEQMPATTSPTILVAYTFATSWNMSVLRRRRAEEIKCKHEPRA